jgi:hypothetical protein
MGQTMVFLTPSRLRGHRALGLAAVDGLNIWDAESDTDLLYFFRHIELLFFVHGLVQA